ncbi:hypothetical protein [Pedobacter sp. SL55]|uniref:hypothetical protein n=1 Tax=Pedobacter sp. SL55 TaxID=2995161 RepID=UPI002270FBA4|nr:hypothetical protein [Pedobacter sp. SL55]WAC39706.1 hypothetical protein OVA16_14105 [Pedobacter sp. SL55]
MKFLSLLTVLLFAKVLLFAQDINVLPKDETGKYTYYEVVSTNLAEDSLKIRAIDFIAKNKKEIKLKSSEAPVQLKGTGKIVINKSLAMLSRPTGEITFTFNFEVNAQKYRFWLTDFEFIPYQKDRYGNFVPSTTVGVALETEAKKSNADQWEDYRLQASKYAANFAKRFKDHLVSKLVATKPSPEKKVISKTW